MFGQLLWIFIAYLCGSISFGLIFGRMFANIDPRTAGSCNVGATNVARLCGKKIGALTLICDLLKGAVPVLIAMQISPSVTFHSLVALAALLGHLHSCFLKFKGGKAAATTLGVYMALAPSPFIYVCILAFFVIYFSGFVSLGSLFLVTATPIALILAGRWELVPVSLIIMVLVYWSHRENIGRLSRGEEKPWQRKKYQAEAGE
ncbi:MAG: glycerol-3-phosphate 1-O-acyltransferase PlsY [Pseudomonadota bacterium]